MDTRLHPILFAVCVTVVGGCEDPHSSDAASLTGPQAAFTATSTALTAMAASTRIVVQDDATNEAGWEVQRSTTRVGAILRGVTDRIAPNGVVEAHIGYKLFDASGIGFSLDAYNVLNHVHRETLSGASVGRMIVSRMQLRM